MLVGDLSYADLDEQRWDSWGGMVQVRSRFVGRIHWTHPPFCFVLCSCQDLTVWVCDHHRHRRHHHHPLLLHIFGWPPPLQPLPPHACFLLSCFFFCFPSGRCLPSLPHNPTPNPNQPSTSSMAWMFAAGNHEIENATDSCPVVACGPLTAQCYADVFGCHHEEDYCLRDAGCSDWACRAACLKKSSNSVAQALAACFARSLVRDCANASAVAPPPLFLSYDSRFRMPWAETGGQSNEWYSWEAGLLHVTVLNSYAAYDVGSPQHSWLVSDLASVDRSRTPWLVVVFHCPWCVRRPCVVWFCLCVCSFFFVCLFVCGVKEGTVLAVVVVVACACGGLCLWWLVLVVACGCGGCGSEGRAAVPSFLVFARACCAVVHASSCCPLYSLPSAL